MFDRLVAKLGKGYADIDERTTRCGRGMPTFSSCAKHKRIGFLGVCPFPRRARAFFDRLILRCFGIVEEILAREGHNERIQVAKDSDGEL